MRLFLAMALGLSLIILAGCGSSSACGTSYCDTAAATDYYPPPEMNQSLPVGSDAPGSQPYCATNSCPPSGI